VIRRSIRGILRLQERERPMARRWLKSTAMKVFVAGMVLGAALGFWLVDENRLAGAFFGVIGGFVIAFGALSFPKDDPQDGGPMVEADDHDDDHPHIHT